MSRRVLLLVLIAALAVTLGFWSFTPLEAMAVLKSGGYWLILAGFVCFAVALTRSLRDIGPEVADWRRWLAPVGVAAAATLFLHLHEPHEFKIVADEVVLQLTAKQMHFSREVAVTVRGYEYAGNFETLVTYVDKRPMLFPFLVATVHDLTGYRVGNVYFLNAVLSGVMMLLFLLIGRRIGGWGGGIAAVLLVTTIPLVAQNACGAGFEVLNLVMILLTLWLGLRAADQPANDDRLGAFVLSGVLLAQTRYESALFVVPVAGAVIYLWWRQRAVRLPWALLAAPLLLVACPLQFNVFKLSQAAWQLNDIAGADEPFGFRYFYDNVGHALNFFLSFDGTQPNSVLVAVLGVLAIGFFVLVFYRKHREMFARRPADAVLTIFLLGLLIHSLLMLCYFWGRWDDLVIHRLSLPTHALMVIATVLIWPQLVTHARRWLVLSIVALGYLVSFTVPSNAMHRFTQQNFAAAATNWLAGHIRALGDRTALAIDENAGLQWFLYDKSSATAAALAVRPEAFIFHFRNHSFAEFLVVQRTTPITATGERIIRPNDDFGDALQLELIEERAFAPFYLVRISRIVGLDEPKFLAWARQRREHPPVTPRGTPVISPQENEAVLEWLRQLP